jgi:hypothetical protein
MGNKYQVFRTKHPRWHVVNALLSMFLPFCLVALTAFIMKVDDSRVILAIYAMFGSFVLGEAYFYVLPPIMIKRFFGD